MQESATQPVQPAESPPAPGTATIVTEGATIAIPTTPEQLQGLRERREILRDHLARAVNRREELVSQLNETGNLEARTGLQERLGVLDERIVQLERDQAATEQLISNAPPEVLALSREPNIRGGPDDEDLAGFWFFGFGVGVLLTIIVGRWRRRRRRRRQGATGVPVLAEDPRLERLNQAVDAIAEEVERIGEGQRFVTQLLAERDKAALPKTKV